MQHYLSYYARKFGKDSILMSPQAVRCAEHYAWPGNIRELRNVSEQLAVLCEGNIITADDIASVLPVETAHSKPLVPQDQDDPSLDGLQKRQIIDVLSRASSRKEAAGMLGISKTTLWRRCRELGLD